MHALCCVALLLLVACPSISEHRTQLVVSVDAAPQLKTRLKALQVAMFHVEDSDESMPRRRHVIPLSQTAQRSLPFSFGITRGTSDRMRLAIGGCTDEACAELLVVQKLLVRFQSGQTSHVSVVLLPACLERSCVGLEQSCDRGVCAPVQEQSGTIIEPGSEMHPTISDTFLPDAEQAERDASGPVVPTAPIVMPMDAPTVMPVMDASAPKQCPSDNECQSAIYPCVPDDGDGYTCLGQFADWPIPDSLAADGGVLPRYALIGEGVTRDEVTHLEWQRKTPPTYSGCSGKRMEEGDGCTWHEARSYCAALSLQGDDWRLPSKIELESLLDFQRHVETIDSRYFFTTTYRAGYWSNSPSASPFLPDHAYTVVFLTGFTIIEEKATFRPVRCVRSEPRVLNHAPWRWTQVDDAIGDARTGLSWNVRVPCEGGPDVAKAADYCSGLGNQWRLPTAKEALTLVDPTQPTTDKLPAVHYIFAQHLKVDNAYAYYMTSTPAKSLEEPMLVEAKFGQAVTPTMATARAELAGVQASYCTQCVR